MFTSNGHFSITGSNEIFLVKMMHHGMVQSFFCGFLKCVNVMHLFPFLKKEHDKVSSRL
jgi:hypothetical protein